MIQINLSTIASILSVLSVLFAIWVLIKARMVDAELGYYELFKKISTAKDAEELDAFELEISKLGIYYNKYKPSLNKRVLLLRYRFKNLITSRYN